MTNDERGMTRYACGVAGRRAQLKQWSGKTEIQIQRNIVNSVCERYSKNCLVKGAQSASKRTLDYASKKYALGEGVGRSIPAPLPSGERRIVCV